MAKTWQRRICDETRVEDITQMEVGTEFVWESRTIKKCPACGRNGVEFKVDRPPEVGPSYAGIAHVVESGATRYFRDYCVEAEFQPNAPTLVVYDVHGDIKAEHWPTSHKAEPSNGEGNKN